MVSEEGLHGGLLCLLVNTFFSLRFGSTGEEKGRCGQDGIIHSSTIFGETFSILETSSLISGLQWSDNVMDLALQGSGENAIYHDQTNDGNIR